MNNRILSPFIVFFIASFFASSVFAGELKSVPLTNINTELIHREFIGNDASENETDVGYIRFCQEFSDLSRFNTFGVDMPMSMYIPVSKQIMSMYDGVEITAIYCAVGSTTRTEVPIEIFLGTDMGHLQYSQAATLPGTGEMTRIELDKPFVVDGTKDLCFGFNIDSLEGDYPILTDGAVKSYGELCGVVRYEAGSSYSFMRMSESDLGNLMLYAEYSGKVEKKLVPWITYTGTPQRIMSAYPETTIPYEIDIYNMGTVPISSVEAEVSINAGEPVTFTGKKFIGPGAANYIMADLTVPNMPGKYNMLFRLKKINDEPVNPDLVEEFYHPLYVIPTDIKYTQRVVCEEFTGTWCGICPEGIWGMEYMNKKYPDTFIGLPIHYDDNLTSATTYDVVKRYNPNEVFPYMTVNRDEIYSGFKPNPTNLEGLQKQFTSNPAVVDLKVDAIIENNETAKTDVTMTFGVSETKADYRIAIVLLEKDIHAVQTNYYSGGGLGECGGWEFKPYEVGYTFPETVVDMFDAMGLPKSVPSEIEAGMPIVFSYDVPLINVNNKENIQIVAMLIDMQTGCIVNAAKFDSTTNIEKNIQSENIRLSVGKGTLKLTGSYSEAEIFNLSGLKVADITNNEVVNLQSGVYIVRVKERIQKIIIR